MPYTIKNPPERITGLPKHAQEIWIAAYNSAIKQYDGNEGKANATAWSAVKKAGYKKDKEGKWIKMNEPRLIFDIPLAFAEMPDGKYKSTIPIARIGKWKHPVYGDFEISSKDLNEIEANFGTVRESQPPINYEHSEGVDASIGAAGWVQKIWRDDGKLSGEVFWTSEGWKKIQAGAFKYISPEIRFHYKDKEKGQDKGTVLVGAALTTKPWIEDLVINLSENIFIEEDKVNHLARLLDIQEVSRDSIFDALKNFLKAKFSIDLPDIEAKVRIIRTLMESLGNSTYLSEIAESLWEGAIAVIEEFQGREWTTAAAKTTGVGDDKKGGEEVDIKKLVEKLKLKEDVTEGDVLAALDSMIAQSAQRFSELRKKIELGENATFEELLAEIEALKKKVSGQPDEKKLAEQVDTLNKTVQDLIVKLAEVTQRYSASEVKLKEKEVAERLDVAMRAGKLTKVMVDTWAKDLALTDLSRFDKILSAMPVVVNLTELGSAAMGEKDPIVKFNDAVRKVQEEKKLSYRDAVELISRENPQLAMEYQEAARQG